MNSLAARFRNLWQGDFVQKSVYALLIAAIGVVLGIQYINPDKRVLATLAALVMFGVGWRLDLVSGLGVLLIAIPFPRGTSFGNTNLVFVLGLFIIWVLRSAQRDASPPRRTPLDVAIAAMVSSYIISFYNVSDPVSLGRGLLIFFNFLACVIMFYLIVANVRTEQGLRRLHVFQVVAIGLIYLFCFWELAFPGHVLIPGWIDLTVAINPEIAVRNYRVGGPFFDYEHLSEFTAMTLFFFLFLAAQARSMTRRVVYIVFIIVTLFIQFTTITRGGLVAMLAGLAYLLFLTRRRVQFVPLVIVGGAAVLMFFGLDAYVAKHTSSGDVFARLAETKFVGLAPDSRAPVWPQAWQRWMEHPLVGWGPYYSSERGLIFWYWPHSLLLFVGNCFGFVGLAIFLWFVYKLWVVSKPPTDRLDDPNYAKAFLLVAHVQMAVFLIDELKIEYMRSKTYSIEVWVFFSMMAAAYMIVNQPAEDSLPVKRPMRLVVSQART